MEEKRFLSRTILFVLCLVTYCNGGDVCKGPTCEFTLIVRHVRSMTYFTNGRSYNVEANGTRLHVAENSLWRADTTPIIGQEVSPDDVITLDGHRKTIIVVNDTFPGPTLEVVEGVEMVVHVVNHLYTEGITIHWHGIHQTDTPWMDGTAYITQCPIQPHQTFTYRFTASPAGTHWYHSHVANQRMDGLFGMLIVHPKLPEMPHIPLMIQDWYELDSRDRMVVDPWVLPLYLRGSGDLNIGAGEREYSQDGVQLSAMRGYTGLINGRGRSGDFQLPLTSFSARKGQTVRLCIANVGAEFAWQVSLDNHKLKVVASDGYEMSPTDADFVNVEPGESFDLEVTATQEVGAYWFRARTLRATVGWNPRVMDGKNVEVKAILRYEGAAATADPTTTLTQCTSARKCLVFNCNFQDYAEKYHRECVHFTDVSSTYSQQYLQDNFGVQDTEVVEYFLNFAFPAGSSVNARRFLLPQAPLSTDGAVGDHVFPCDKEVCDADGCACTHILDIPRDRTVQLVLANLVPSGQPTFGHHPVHIHGTSFAVMATGYPDMNITTGLWAAPNSDIECESRLCARGKWRHGPPAMNHKNPVVKDTIVAPARGYTVVRFRSTNPGFWFVHCHAEQHVSNGMDIIFNIGPGEHPPLPKHFPTCSRFDPLQSDEVEEKSEREEGTDSYPCPGRHFVLSGVQLIGIIISCLAAGGVCCLSPVLFYKRRRKKPSLCDCSNDKMLSYKPVSSSVNNVTL